jgi:hypothetical protein
MLTERIRNAPLLTPSEASSLFEAALETVSGQQKGLISMDRLLDALANRIASAVAIAASELKLQETAPPWVKAEQRKLSNTTV